VLKAMILTILFAQVVFAADGFKDLKFGMSFLEVEAKKYCRLEYKETSEKAVDVYLCNNLKLGQHTRSAQLFFINKKFQKIMITVGKRYSDMELAASFLKDEFGSPSSMFDIRAIQAFNAGIRDDLSIGFDQNTVLLKLAKIGARGEVTLTYSNPDFYTLVLAEKRRAQHW
jgi:hypothetical protein